MLPPLHSPQRAQLVPHTPLCPPPVKLTVPYVVTGPILEGSNLQQIGAGVLVPTSTYKAVYDPATNTAWRLRTNQPECRTVSVAELAQLTGIDVSLAVPGGQGRPAPATPAARTPGVAGRARRGLTRQHRISQETRYDSADLLALR